LRFLDLHFWQDIPSLIPVINLHFSVIEGTKSVPFDLINQFLFGSSLPVS
jgi:hypothetical protein